MTNDIKKTTSKSNSKSKTKSQKTTNVKVSGRGKHPNSLANLRQGINTVTDHKLGDNDRHDKKIHSQKQINKIVNKAVGYNTRSHNYKTNKLNNDINKLQTQIDHLKEEIIDLKLENTLLKCKQNQNNVLTVLINKCYDGVNELIKTCKMRMKSKPRFVYVYLVILFINIPIYFTFVVCLLWFLI